MTAQEPAWDATVGEARGGRIVTDTRTPPAPEPRSKAGIVDALAYALARADLPGPMETSREYAARLAPLFVESGYFEAARAAGVAALREALEAVEFRSVCGPHCPDCDGTRDAGHYPGCRIAAALAAAPPPAPQPTADLDVRKVDWKLLEAAMHAVGDDHGADPACPQLYPSDAPEIVRALRRLTEEAQHG